MTKSSRPRARPKRQANGIYVDDIGLHQCALPLEGQLGSLSSISMGDNNHAILVTDDNLVITTRVQTALSMYMQGLLGEKGKVHRLAVGLKELGDAAYAGLILTNDNRYDRVRLMFNRVHAATQVGHCIV